MRLQLPTRQRDVELGERQVARTWTGDQYVVDRRSQFVEESAEPVEVGRVEGGDAAIDLETGALHALRVACRDNHLGSLVVGSPCCLQADPGAPTDHEEGLPGELPVARRHAGFARSATSATAWRLTSSLVGAGGPVLEGVIGTESPCTAPGGVAPGEVPGQAISRTA